MAKWWSARLEIEGSVVRASQDNLYCILEQETLSSALIVNGLTQEKSQHD